MDSNNIGELTVCITGAAGQIAYSFIPQLLKGNAFGNRKINLKLLDITPALNAMKGVVMEIKDCAFPLCKTIEYGDNPREMFKNADVIIFFGGFPRKKGM
jgi:malate/lactate dehydrogenase